MVSTFGPFSFIEGAIVLIGLSVLLLLRQRSQGREFHVPFGDGTVIAAAGAWSGVLILIRLFDRPLGQNLLALVCAAILIVAGLAERRKRLPDDLPQADAAAHQRDADTLAERPRRRRSRGRAPSEETTRERTPRAPDPDPERLFDPESGTIDELRSVNDAPTQPLPPPEFHPPERPAPPEED